jgi:filamentous hemagglutinin family protein
MINLKICQYSGQYLLGTLAIICIYSIDIPRAIAQIIPDSTLPTNSTVTTQGNTLTINNGSTAGNNLFHSLDQFSVDRGQTAYFNNSPNIENIITRVTGNSISNINGIISANGNANLFLLNKNGIIFGANAGLRIGGSFFASTAENMRFADGSIFTTNKTTTTPLLSITTPIGIQWNNNPQGKIENFGNLIAPKDLTFAAASFTSNGNNSNIEVPNGNLNISTTVGDITVNNITAKSVELSAKNNVILDNGQLITNERFGNEIFRKSGNITINSGNDVKIQGNIKTFSSKAEGGDIFIEAPNSIVIENGIFDSSGFLGSGNINLVTSGNVDINRSQLSSSNISGVGDAGGIVIKAQSVNLNFQSAITSAGSMTLMGKGGDINIDTGSFNLSNLSSLSSGNGGSIKIRSENLDLNTSIISAKTNLNQGGNIDLEVANVLLLQRSSQISATADSDVNSGNIFINANFISAIAKENSNILALASSRNGGNIQIRTRRIFGLENRPQQTSLSDITASSQYGVSGIVDISIFGKTLNESFVALPSKLEDTKNTIAESCAANLGTNTFVASGKGGLPPERRESLNNTPGWIDWRTEIGIERDSIISAQKTTTRQNSPVLIPADAWVFHPDGTVSLVANNPRNLPNIVYKCITKSLP